MSESPPDPCRPLRSRRHEDQPHQPEKRPDSVEQEHGELGQLGEAEHDSCRGRPPPTRLMQIPPENVGRRDSQSRRTHVGCDQPGVGQDVRAEDPERQAQESAPGSVKPPRPGKDGKASDDREQRHHQSGELKELEVACDVQKWQRSGRMSSAKDRASSSSASDREVPSRDSPRRPAARPRASPKAGCGDRAGTSLSASR